MLWVIGVLACACIVGGEEMMMTMFLLMGGILCRAMYEEFCVRGVSQLWVPKRFLCFRDVRLGIIGLFRWYCDGWVML